MLRQRIFFGFALSAIAFAVLIVGCWPIASNSITPAKSDKIQVVVTTSIVADLVKQVGGDHVDVTAIMPPGIDPHRYSPLPADTLRLANADVVFYSGLHLEGKMVDVLSKASIHGRSPVAVTKSIPKNLLRKADEGDEYDPHVWFDVKLWIHAIDPIVETLCQIDPGHAESFKSNAARHGEQLSQLHQDVKTTIAKLPKDKRVLITSHDAFGYFAAAYDFEVHGLQGVSTASEVGIEDRRLLADLLTKKNVAAVFGETSVPTKGLQSVLDTVKAKTGKSIQIIGGNSALYSDSLGDTGSPGETYIGMVRHNVNVIVGALNK